MLYNLPCIECMSLIKAESISLILTSPPYNFNTKRSDCYYNNGYKQLDNLSIQDYVKVRINEFHSFKRILKPNAVIAYNLNYGLEMPHLPIALLSELLYETEFTVADYISWKKPHSIPFQTSPRKLSRVVEMIYVIVRKSELKTYFVNKEVSKINEKTGQKFYKNYVNFVQAANNDRVKSTHKAAFSTELAEKMINLFSKEDDIVYDPFMGIGTTGVACKNLNRNFIGSEIIEEYFKIAQDRV